MKCLFLLNERRPQDSLHHPGLAEGIHTQSADKFLKAVRQMGDSVSFSDPHGLPCRLFLLGHVKPGGPGEIISCARRWDSRRWLPPMADTPDYRDHKLEPPVLSVRVGAVFQRPMPKCR